MTSPTRICEADSSLAGVFHFSFTVTDLDVSIRWYTDVLGLQFVNRQRQDNDYTRELVGFDDAVIEIAQFKVPCEEPRLSSHMLELVQYMSPLGVERFGLIPTNDVGSAHLAFVVLDAEAMYARLKERGVLFRSPPVKIDAGANAGGKAAYFQDPDGITLEILEPPSSAQRRMGMLEEDTELT